MDLEYELKKSKRAKNIRLTVRSDATVLLTIPWWVPKYVGKKFFEAKKNWVIEQIRNMQNEITNDYPRLTKKDYLKNKERARKFILEKLNYYNRFYNFDYGRVSIRDTRTRWGSCSVDGNLNFSYKLLFLPEAMADYIIVHELCHLREHNHSKNFWLLVEKIIPNYKDLRRALKKTHF